MTQSKSVTQFVHCLFDGFFAECLLISVQPTVALKHGRIQIQTVAFHSFRQAFSLPLPKGFIESVHVPHSKALEVADPDNGTQLLQISSLIPFFDRDEKSGLETERIRDPATFFKEWLTGQHEHNRGS